MRLGKDIQRIAPVKGIDPYNIHFAPKDLGLRSSNYGSFSDWCSKKQSASGKHNRNVCLKVVEWDSSKRPHKYVLLPQNKWYVEK